MAVADIDKQLNSGFPAYYSSVNRFCSITDGKESLGKNLTFGLTISSTHYNIKINIFGDDKTFPRYIF